MKTRTVALWIVTCTLLFAGTAMASSRGAGSTAMTALRDLDLMNINYLTLFPDAFGTAHHSNMNTDIFRSSLAVHDFEKKK